MAQELSLEDYKSGGEENNEKTQNLTSPVTRLERDPDFELPDLNDDSILPDLNSNDDELVLPDLLDEEDKYSDSNSAKGSKVDTSSPDFRLPDLD